MKRLNTALVALTTSVQNLLNIPSTSSLTPVGFTMPQPHLVVTKVQYVNTTAAPITVQLFKGATTGSAAGTEVYGSGLSIPANGVVNDYGELRLDSTDFLTGKASATGVTVRLEVEADMV